MPGIFASGRIAPRGNEHAPLVESVGGQWLLALMIERKALPSAVVKRRTDELAQQVEHSSGRKPGKKETKELKEQATLELLPMAFTKRATIRVWIDARQRLLMVDASSTTRAGEVVTRALGRDAASADKLMAFVRRLAARVARAHAESIAADRRGRTATVKATR